MLQESPEKKKNVSDIEKHADSFILSSTSVALDLENDPSTTEHGKNPALSNGFWQLLFRKNPRKTRATWRVFLVWGVGVFLFGGLLTATLLVPRVPGYQIDAGLVFGSLLTLCSSVLLGITYHAMGRFQIHPNPLIYYRSNIDLCLSLRFLLEPLWEYIGLYSAHRNSSCGVLSGVTEWLFLSAEGWFLMMAVDLYVSLTNPFTNLKRNRKNYHIFVNVFATTLSLALYLAGNDLYGFATGKYCWTKSALYDWSESSSGSSSHNKVKFTKLNFSNWLFFYIWVILFYVIGLGVIIFGVRRLNSGLAETLRTRRGVLRNGAINIMSYSVYWTIAFIAYAVSYNVRHTKFIHQWGNGSSSSVNNHGVFGLFSFVLAGRGIINFWVWFQVNDPELMTKANWLNFKEDSQPIRTSSNLSTNSSLSFSSSTSSTNKTDTDVSVQMNEALQQELVFYTIKGISQSILHAEQKLYPTLNEEQNDNMKQEKNEQEEAEEEEKQCEQSKSVSKQSEWMEFWSPSSSEPIEFVSYESGLFCRLRHHLGLTDASEFLSSFSECTKPSISEGASGAFLFFSGDQKYLIKSMAKEECELLTQLCSCYVDHLIGQKNSKRPSLLIHFLGCFRMTLYGQQFYFVIMQNLLHTSISDEIENNKVIHHRYDIKGSWVNRSYKRPRHGAMVKCRHCRMRFQYTDGQKKNQKKNKCPNVVGPHEPNVVLKDDDLTTMMRIGLQKGEELYEQLCADTAFLCSFGIMDYSLLIGVSDVEFEIDAKGRTGGHNNTFLSQLTSPASSFISSASSTSESHLTRSSTSSNYEKKRVSRLKVPSDSNNTTIKEENEGEEQREDHVINSESVVGPGYYYIGIIDILQKWNFDKKMERFAKTYILRKDPKGISAVEPVEYRRRFLTKMREIILLPELHGKYANNSTLNTTASSNNENPRQTSNKNLYSPSSEAKKVLIATGSMKKMNQDLV